MTLGVFPKVVCGGLNENDPHRLIHASVSKTGKVEPSNTLTADTELQDLKFAQPGFSIPLFPHYALISPIWNNKYIFCAIVCWKHYICFYNL